MREDWNVKLGNIFAVYARADKWDREFGMEAYERYQDRICKIADETSFGLRTACGVFAVMSPNIDEAANFLALERLLLGKLPVPGYPKNVEKARQIMESADKTPLDYIVGLKTRAFYQNLYKPWDLSNDVVVDAHMYSVWQLKRHKVTSIHMPDKLYHEIARDFTKVAVAVGIRPNQLQAICWSTWKRVNNIVFDGHQTKLVFA